MEHSRGALDVKLVVFNHVSNMTIFNLKTLMIIKTKTEDCQGIRKEERNEIIHGLLIHRILGNSILSIYYRYLIQGTSAWSRYIINFVFSKNYQLASKVGIESLPYSKMTCALLGKVME